MTIPSPLEQWKNNENIWKHRKTPENNMKN
jgi:hypothetical protein